MWKLCKFLGKAYLTVALLQLIGIELNLCAASIAPLSVVLISSYGLYRLWKKKEAVTEATAQVAEVTEVKKTEKEYPKVYKMMWQ